MKLQVYLGRAAIDFIVWTLAVYCGFLLVQKVRIIPYEVFPLPYMAVSPRELLIMIVTFFSFHGILAILCVNKYDVRNPISPSQFAHEYMLYLIAFTISVYFLFFGTNINFDAQIIGLTGMLSSVFLFTKYVIFNLIYKTSEVSVLDIFWQPIRSTMKAFVSLAGILVLCFFLTPFGMAMMFYSNPSAANLISKARLALNEKEIDSEWGLEDINPDLNLDQPMLVQFDPTDENIIYVLEREGRLLRMPYVNATKYDVIVDFSEQVGPAEIENGALGFDLHPEYGKSDEHRFVYIYYTSSTEGQQRNRLARFDMSSVDSEAVLASELILFDIGRRPSGYHNGGSVEFGPDGFLYVGLGEGIRMSREETMGDALRAGIIRIDVDMKGGDISRPIERQPANGNSSNYFIPKDNPFVGSPHAMDELWAVGLRNPFRMNFDGQSGALWVGDVGTATWEEINLVESGRDYQYPYVEGFEPTKVAKSANQVGVEQQPVFAYEHTAADRAVIGGNIYRGTIHPSLSGHYIFADSYSAKLFYISIEDGAESEMTFLARGSQYARRGISSVKISPQGDVIATTLGGVTKPSGQILRLVLRQDAPDLMLADLPSDYDDEDIEQLFRDNCGRCHGNNGAADGPDSADLGVPMPNFTERGYFEERSLKEIKAIIANGGEAEGMSAAMPPWKDLLHDQEIDALANYIKELGKG